MRDFLFILCGRLATALISLISVRLITSLLAPEEFAHLSLLITVQTFCGLFLINPVGQFINLKTHEWWDEGGLLSNLRLYFHYVLAVSVIGAIAVFLLPLDDSLGEIAVASLVVAIAVIAGTWNTTILPLMNMLGWRFSSTSLQVLTASSGLIFSLLFVRFEATAVNWLAGQVIGFAIGAGVGWVVLLRRGGIISRDVASTFVDLDVIRRFCFPLAMATIFIWYMQSGYRVLLEEYQGLSFLAYFVLGLQVANQIGLLAETLFAQFFYPLFFKRCSKSKEIRLVSDAFSDLFNVLSPLYVLIIFAMLVFRDLVFEILVDDQYSGAVKFFTIGVALELFRLVTNVFSNAANVLRRPHILIFGYSTGAAFLLVFWVIIDSLGMAPDWFGYSLILSYSVSFAVISCLVLRDAHISVDWIRISMALVSGSLLYYSSGLVIFGPLDGYLIFLYGVFAVLFGIAGFAVLWRSAGLARLLGTKLMVF